MYKVQIKLALFKDNHIYRHYFLHKEFKLHEAATNYYHHLIKVFQEYIKR